MTRPVRSRLQPAPVDRVRIDGGFWGVRQETSRAVTLLAEYDQFRKTGRINAFKLDWKPGKAKKPHYFWDSDVAKWIEAVAYSLATHPDKKLERLVDRVIDLIGSAQQKDGYLNVYFTVVEPRKRWSNLRDCHELYCAGHLIEAAVAYYEATGKRRFLDVMCRYADYIGKVFGSRRGQKRGYPGHQEIELALVKLHRATGHRRYLDLAAFFINQRGTAPNYFDKEAKARREDGRQFESRIYGAYDRRPHVDRQAHIPVRQQHQAVGHAVRAMYLYCGMIDVAAETGDKTLLAACRRLWNNVTGKRMYITGGIGSLHANEGFSRDYDLPSETAYAETCAAIGLVFWAHRMLQTDPDARYADVMERAIYNGMISGVSLDGAGFFYVNPLADGGRHRRQGWFGCACCPPNIARMIASVGGYMYSQTSTAAWVHLYAAGRVELVLGRQRVKLTQTTQYPWRETVRINVEPERASVFTIALRMPGWCKGAVLSVNGKRVGLARVTRRGYAKIRRKWDKGDRIDLRLPMPVERVEADPRCAENVGRLAIQRGPIVYCLEEVDNGKDTGAIMLPADGKLTAKFDRDLLGGVTVVTGRGKRPDPAGWSDGALYRSGKPRLRSTTITAVPYCVWANRAPGQMRVWLVGC